MRLRNLSVFAVLVVGLVQPLSASAGTVPFAGALVDSSAIPKVPPVNTVVNPPGGGPPPDIWGTGGWSTWVAGPCEAVYRVPSATPWDNANCEQIAVNGGSGSLYFGMPIHIPSGASVQYAVVYFNETVLGDTIGAGFWKYDRFGNMTLIVNMGPTATAVGDTYQEWGPFSETINNESYGGYTYAFLAYLPNASKIYKMGLFYKLQVSPAPASATFADVPTNYWAFRHIEALYASGITAGCGTNPLIFCPENYIRRSEMAVYLAKALGLYYPY